MIEVFDNFFDNEVFQNYLNKFWKDNIWEAEHNKFNYSHAPERWNYNKSLGKKTMDNNRVVVEELDPLDQNILSAITNQIYMITGKRSEPIRYYSNSHTYGVDGPIHHDDGDVTAIFYPHNTWKAEWEGGTAIYDKNKKQCLSYVTVQPNRLVLFDASLPHRAMPLTRECYEIRASIVVKNRFIDEKNI